MLSQWRGFLPDFLDGLKVTMELTGASLLVGLPLGVLLALLVASKVHATRWIAIVGVEIGRGTPGLIMLYLVYYGLPQLHITLGNFLAATIGLGITTGAYTSEVFRAGINAVPDGQREASQALGLSAGHELRLVVLPQAIRLVIPPVIGFSILLYQGTSLAYAISTPELLSRAYNAATISYQFTAALTLAGLMYAVISLTAVALLRLRRPSRIGRRTPTVENAVQI
ncbi:MAG: amino acid ABC transporter permease [Mycobacteriales bacterium]